jgi:iron complex transport system permease protein
MSFWSLKGGVLSVGQGVAAHTISWRWVLAFVVAFAVLSLASLSAGKVWVPWSVWFSGDHDLRSIIVFELRLPRTILAIAVGAALGMCGAALQGYARNPLADPGVLGVSSMASLGAVLTLYMRMSATLPWLLPTGGMLGAMLGTLILVSLAGATSSLLTFILAGMVLNTVAGAGVALALNLAPTPWAVNEIVNWLLGSLADRSFGEVQFAVPFIVIGMILMLTTRRALDALTLGEAAAQSLGINLPAMRITMIVGVGLAAGASVAVTGVIGFVGLITPHLIRPLVGSPPGALLMPSAVAGALILLAADVVVRLLPSVVELKLGIVMAALGGPFFLMRLLALRRSVA